jgi:hypothetical protein
MEYKIEERGFYTSSKSSPDFGLIGDYDHTFEFEDAQSMFDRIVDRWSDTSYVDPSRGPELSPSIGKYNHTLFFEKTNIIELREYPQYTSRKMAVWKCTGELIITDDEGNRVNIDSLSDLIGLEGVDSSGIRIRDGKVDTVYIGKGPIINYEAPIEG